MPAEPAILAINSGSSSVKFALFGNTAALPRLWSGAVERIGLANSSFHASGGEQPVAAGAIRDHEAAMQLVLEAVERQSRERSLSAVGHRVVHGGAEFAEPAIVDAAMLARLDRLVPLAPLHLPHNLAGIAVVCKNRPDLAQIACFDTAFHQTLTRLATLTALPREYYGRGIRRYGFHGLSYEYVVEALRRDGADVDHERVIVAHLGNGASMCAVAGGRSVETTMGFSALGGLPMGTRCGDLDPGIVLYLADQLGMPIRRVEKLLYEESGLLGISGLSRNMQDLLAKGDDPAASEAVEFFCLQARKHVGALAAALGGIDRLVFTGGIGANAPAVRAKICAGLEFLGIALDAARNTSGVRVISSAGAQVVVQAFDTDEELVIARHVRRLLAAQSVSASLPS